MAESGGITRRLLVIGPNARDDRTLTEQFCRACVAGLDVDGAAISLHTASSLRETLPATDPTADLLEELQFALGEGPWMEAVSTGRPVLVPDLKGVTEICRWPLYAASALDQAGAGAVFALPLQWATINLGVLDLYRRAPGSLAPSQLRDDRDRCRRHGGH